MVHHIKICDQKIWSKFMKKKIEQKFEQKFEQKILTSLITMRSKPDYVEFVLLQLF